jgi:PAS domain S-box-containing protein
MTQSAGVNRPRKALNMNLEWNAAQKSPCSASARCKSTPVNWNALPAVGVTQAATDLVAVADRAGRLTFVSDVAEYVLGLGPRFLVGRALLDLVQPEDRIEMKGVLEQAVNSDAPISARIHLLDACGAPHSCEVFVANKLSHPFVRGFALTFRVLD